MSKLIARGHVSAAPMVTNFLRRWRPRLPHPARQERSAVHLGERSWLGRVQRLGYFGDVRNDRWQVVRREQKHRERTTLQNGLLVFHVLVRRDKHVEACALDQAKQLPISGARPALRRHGCHFVTRQVPDDFFWNTFVENYAFQD